MTLTPQWLDELRARTLLSALIGRSVKVTRAGREWKACCPFHDEKTPSFTINDDKGFYHCLAAETLVMTPQGRMPIAQLAGKTAHVLTRGGQWVPAPFKSFGVQQLWKITLSRNGVNKSLHATSGHRWFVHDRAREYHTDELRRGHALTSILPPKADDWTLDAAGVRHGIMFGDGSMYKSTYGTVNLHGEKDAELRHWFPGQAQHVHERSGGKLYLRIYGGKAFAHMKALPGLDNEPAYLMGFLAGYLAADGHVAKDGTVMLNSACAEHLEGVRDIANALGIATFGRTTLMRKGYGDRASALHRIHFVGSTLHPSLFLLTKHRSRFAARTAKFERLRWVVQSVEPTTRHEEVYCAQVPRHHAFAIDDNILTGNCFGCGAHGDAIRWMTDHRGLSFIDGVKELAASAGMELPAPDPRAAKRAERQLGLRDVIDAAQHWFADNLWGDAGEPVRQYIQSRGISRRTAEAFGMGFAPDRRDGVRSALSRFGDAMGVEAGMLISVDDKQPYDRFRGRLMIPIRDARGRAIGFGGRALDLPATRNSGGGGEGSPKYLNSPDTPLFDKGRVLFNLDRAAAAARKSERLIIVEGYMDVIALAEAGLADAVAPLGTALTEAQLELAWRQVDVPLLAFDGDAAGQRAAMRGAMRALPLLRPGRSLAFIRLPQGKDPDDIVRGGGADAFTRLCDDATPLVDFLWQAALASQRDDTPEARAMVRAELDKWVGEMTDREVAAHYRHGFNERVSAHFFARTPRDGGAAPHGKGRGRTPHRPPEKPPSPVMRNIAASIDTGLIAAILAGIIRYPALIGEQIDLISRLPVPEGPLKTLHLCLMEMILDVSGLDMEGLLTILRTNNQYNIAHRVLGADKMRFSFTREIVEKDAAANARAAAAQDLRDAIATIVAWGEAEEALQRATAHFAEQMDEASFAEQQRAMQARQYLAEQIATMREVAEKSAV